MKLSPLVTRVSSATGLAVVVAVLTATISTSAAAASQRGQMGGPPTIALGSSDKGERTTPRSSGAGFEVPQPQIKFSRRTSNGYLITFEANRGRASLRAQSGAGGVVYSGKSSLADGRIRFSLGKLGRIDARFEPNGSVDRLRPPRSCKGPEQVVRSGTFVGSIRFRGENSYTQLSSNRAHGTMAEPRSWKCPGASDGPPQTAGGTPVLIAHTPHSRVIFMAIGASEQVPFRFFIAGTSEQVGALHVGRSALVEGVPASFEALGDLSSATVGPPKPFSGTASFVRNVDGSTEWSGTLSVALPGVQSVALAGPAFEADLAKPKTAEEFSELLGLG